MLLFLSFSKCRILHEKSPSGRYVLGFFFPPPLTHRLTDMSGKFESKYLYLKYCLVSRIQSRFFFSLLYRAFFPVLFSDSLLSVAMKIANL